jgi:two-component system, cell cycle sensor histidine kinase and response regulator CckA
MSSSDQKSFQQTWLKVNSSGKHVLVVDDNGSHRKLLCKVLHRGGYATVGVEDGVEALFALEREPFDLVVSDILMPNMDGYSLCTEVRRRSELKDLRFILCSSIDFTANEEEVALQLGADKLIDRRNSPRALLETIREVTGARLEHGCVYLRRRNDGPSENEIKKYSAVMIRELEERNLDLEFACDELCWVIESLKKRLGGTDAQTDGKEFHPRYPHRRIRRSRILRSLRRVPDG